jgi:hypothetical protein
VLDKDGKDPRFICFNEPISIADNFYVRIIHIYTNVYHVTPHSLYKKSQSLISEGPEQWVDSVLSP